MTWQLREMPKLGFIRGEGRQRPHKHNNNNSNTKCDRRHNRSNNNTNSIGITILVAIVIVCHAPPKWWPCGLLLEAFGQLFYMVWGSRSQLTVKLQVTVGHQRPHKHKDPTYWLQGPRPS